MTKVWSETLYDAFGQHFNTDKVLFESKTSHQNLLIFQNAMFGRVMALDGVVQTTERDEFIYHEMLTHVPILAHGSAKSVLIVGGGDGGMLREVCRHRAVKSITQVEIDQAVIDMAKQYMPGHSQGAYDDPRLNLIIADGMEFVRNTDAKFDVIISDSTDPIGPGEILFTEGFYASCKRCLKQGGVLVTQNGVAFMQLEEVKTTAKRLAPLYKDWSFYGAAVPTYVGGIMTFAWATDNKALRATSLPVLKRRFKRAKLKTRYYNPEIHMAAFALPQYLQETLPSASKVR
ncbi:MAG: spermidine synthase [Gammaproteobacteria bacterium RIFCSPLOWO2_02_FULL_52_10]|nr:MAG: spermidine synthase [Gammaproteobacteria bacterium RIFCSPLOWO2_02_FULL_52_10]OGT82839.1 MAG: spermidine synthase [Gammaproteobacteria bacterium RIFCSPLOWO2_12_FULL_52_10]